MIKDESGQVIILFGFLIASGLIILAVLLNTSLFSGHQTAQGELNSPKAELHDLRVKTLDQVKAAANRSQFKNETRFNEIMSLYSHQITALYASRKAYASIEADPIESGGNISWVQVKLIYRDLYTDYKSLDVIYDLEERK